MHEPRILDRYTLIERLASGGSAEVWRAHDDQLDRLVAVKRLHPHLVPDEASRQRLVTEARAAAGLSHPVIVGVYDVDATGDWPAIVMELVDGEPLSARIAREGPLEPREAAAIAADVADALFHAHQQGVVHRDVKPGNVLLSRDGRTRLVDFGIAHSLANVSARLTQTGTVVGTLPSMAPEQLADGPITPRTDLYGLGAVLHEAVTGRPPHDTTSPLVLADAHRSGPPPMPGVDRALAALVAACLAYEPADRPLHAGAVSDALRAWLAGDSAPALAMAPPVAAAGSDAPTQAVARVEDAAARHDAPAAAGRHRPGGPVFLAIGLTALVALAGWAVATGPAGWGGDAASTDPATATPSPVLPSTPPPTPSSPPADTPPPALPNEGWAGELAKKYLEDCGTELDPALIAGMGKKQAEDVVKELTEQCKRGGDDGDD